MVKRFKNKFTLGDWLFGAVKLTKNADPDKYGYSDYGIGFEAGSNFSINGECGKNVAICCVDNKLSVYIDNIEKDNLVLGKGSRDGLDYTTIITEAKYYVNITNSRKTTCLSLHYNAANSFLYANGVKL